MTIKDISEKYGVTADTLRYYERIGMIPPVHRTEGGIRNYSIEDEKWLEFALCMRSAGLPIEVMIEYMKLSIEGNSTIPARFQLLTEQRNVLLAQKKKIDDMLNKLNYKIGRYEIAVKTGKLTWEDSENENCDCKTINRCKDIENK